MRYNDLPIHMLYNVDQLIARYKELEGLGQNATDSQIAEMASIRSALKPSALFARIASASNSIYIPALEL